MKTPTDRCHELVTSRPFQRLPFVVERRYGHRNVRARQPGTHARPATRGLPSRNAGDVLAPTPAQAEAATWSAKEEVRAWYRGISALRRRPSAGAVRAPGRQGRRLLITGRIRFAADRRKHACPALAARMPADRVRSCSCAGPSIALNWWRTHGYRGDVTSHVRATRLKLRGSR